MSVDRTYRYNDTSILDQAQELCNLTSTETFRSPIDVAAVLETLENLLQAQVTLQAEVTWSSHRDMQHR